MEADATCSRTKKGLDLWAVLKPSINISTTFCMKCRNCYPMLNANTHPCRHFQCSHLKRRPYRKTNVTEQTGPAGCLLKNNSPGLRRFFRELDFENLYSWFHSWYGGKMHFVLKVVNSWIILGDLEGRVHGYFMLSDLLETSVRVRLHVPISPQTDNQLATCNVGVHWARCLTEAHIMPFGLIRSGPARTQFNSYSNWSRLGQVQRLTVWKLYALADSPLRPPL